MCSSDLFVELDVLERPAAAAVVAASGAVDDAVGGDECGDDELSHDDLSCEWCRGRELQPVTMSTKTVPEIDTHRQKNLADLR